MVFGGNKVEGCNSLSTGCSASYVFILPIAPYRFWWPMPLMLISSMNLYLLIHSFSVNISHLGAARVRVRWMRVLLRFKRSYIKADAGLHVKWWWTRCHFGTRSGLEAGKALISVSYYVDPVLHVATPKTRRTDVVFERTFTSIQ